MTEISISHWGMFTVPEPQLEEPEAVAELPKCVLLPDWIDPEIRERVYAEMFA